MKEIRNITVVGEGTMGSSIFIHLCDFDYNLTWLCSSAHAASEARKSIDERYRRFVKSGSMTVKAANSKIETLKFISDPVEIGECDLVIESVSEDLEIKRKLFIELCSYTDPSAILTSNSSSILISEIISDRERLARSAGLHFFYPAPMKETVELILSYNTSRETVSLLFSFLKKIRKVCFLQKEKNPFILNRLLLGLQADTFNILREYDVSVETLELIVSDKILPAGVFRFFDQVGIDIMLASVKSYLKYEDDKEKFEPMLSAFQEMVVAGKLGMKSKEGFFVYRRGESKKDNTYETMDENLKTEIAERLNKNLANSVKRLIEKKHCTNSDLKFYLQDFLFINCDSAERFVNNAL